MNTLRLSLLASLAIAISACSGGGGGSSSSSSTTATNTSTTTTVTKPTTTQPTKTTTTKTDVTPTAPTPPKNSEKRYQGSMTTNVIITNAISHDQVDKITVDGKDIAISPLERVKSSGSIKAGSYNLNIERFYQDDNAVVSGDHTQHVRYGLVGSKAGNQLFFIGEKTKTMPTTGTATYKGYAIATRSKIVDNQWTSTILADFGKKELTGTLVDRSGKTGENIKATISGNSFKGTHSNGTYSEGSFYGTNAAEVAGFFRTYRISGVFGAKKQ